jgi:hypothetical protein
LTGELFSRNRKLSSNAQMRFRPFSQKCESMKMKIPLP